MIKIKREQAEALLQLGKVAWLAEIEEERVIPVDTALEAAGGRLLQAWHLTKGALAV